jgi:hypothetical protein
VGGAFGLGKSSSRDHVPIYIQALSLHEDLLRLLFARPSNSSNMWLLRKHCPNERNLIMRMTRPAMRLCLPTGGVGLGSVPYCIGHKTFEFLFTILVS